MLVTVVGGKGAPGATTTALALASAMDQPTYLVEADSFGGDVAYRCRHAGLPFPESPTVLTATAAARHALAEEVLTRYSHQISEHLHVVPGHLAAEQSFNTDWDALARALSATDLLAIVDVGRVHSASPTFPLMVRADVVVPVLRADATSVVRTLDWLGRQVPELAARRNAAPTLVPVVVTPRRFATKVVEELRELLSGSRVAAAVGGIGWIAYDDGGQQALCSGRSVRRSRLLSSARGIWPEIIRASQTETSHTAGGVDRART